MRVGGGGGCRVLELPFTLEMLFKGLLFVSSALESVKTREVNALIASQDDDSLNGGESSSAAVSSLLRGWRTGQFFPPTCLDSFCGFE